MNKTLILMDDLFYQYELSGEEENGILFLPVYKHNKLNRILMVLRKISLYFGFNANWLGNWTNVVDFYDTIVIGDIGNAPYIVKYIKKRYPKKRVIIWYRNSIKATVVPDKFNRNLCELWTFDKNDSVKYGLKYNHQFYIKNDNYNELPIEYDVFFVGQDKGRLEKLLEIEKEVSSYRFKSKFCIVGYNSERLEYSQILNYIAKSKVILDIQCDWQEGITLRPLEAVFYEKKLITNNKKIKEMDFYNAENIFVLEDENKYTLQDFILSEKMEYSQQTRNEYGLECWVKRFYDDD